MGNTAGSSSLDSQKKGYLLKSKGSSKQLLWYYTVLNGKKLEFYYTESCDKIIETIHLNEYKMIKENDQTPQSYQFLLIPNDDESDDTITFIAKSEQDLNDWISKIQDVNGWMKPDIDSSEDGVKSKEQKRGRVIFQERKYSREQLDHLQKKRINDNNKKEAAAFMLLFADNEIDKNRDEHEPRRYHKYRTESGWPVARYDRSITYGITTIFINTPIPTFVDFVKLINEEFEILKVCLLEGYDIIIPLATPTEIDEHRDLYYNKEKQRIYHNIGTNIYRLSDQYSAPNEPEITLLEYRYLDYIQDKIDELKKIADNIVKVEYYGFEAPVEDQLVSQREQYERKMEEMRLKNENLQNALDSYQNESNHDDNNNQLITPGFVEAEENKSGSNEYEKREKKKSEKKKKESIISSNIDRTNGNSNKEYIWQFNIKQTEGMTEFNDDSDWICIPENISLIIDSLKDLGTATLHKNDFFSESKSCSLITI